MAYQGRQISKGPSVEEANYYAQARSGARKGAQGAQGVAGIGTAIGDAIDDQGYLEKEKKSNKTAPNAKAKVEQAIPKPTFPPITATALESPAAYPDIQPHPPRPQPSIPNKTAIAKNENPYKPQVWGDSSPYAGIPFLAPEKEGSMDWYNPQHPGSGNIVGAQGKDQQSPLDRNSPFNREVAPSSLGFGTGYDLAAQATHGATNALIARQEYKQKVWDRKRKEADQEFGKLVVEPSGVSSYDNSVQAMAKEWQDELYGMMKDKDSWDPSMYSAKVNEIASRSKEYNAAAQNIQSTVADYVENIDNISPSTPPETIDILDTLSKGGGGLVVQNVDGVPTFVGQTLGGADVSVPISQIASGQNNFRFNVAEEIQPKMDAIIKDVSKLTSDKAGQLGVERGLISWDQMLPNIQSKVDGLTKNDHAVRSILADQYGYDYDDVQDYIDQGGDPQKLARELMLEDLQTQMQPMFQQKQIIGNTVINQRNAAAIAETKGVKTTAGERKSSADASNITERLNQIDTISLGNVGQFKGLGKITDVAQAKDGTFGIKIGTKWVELSSDPATAKQQIAQYAGVDARHTSALKRSPLRRVADFFGSPFKKKDKFAGIDFSGIDGTSEGIDLSGLDPEIDSIDMSNIDGVYDQRARSKKEIRASETTDTLRDGYEYLTGKLNPYDRLFNSEKAKADENAYAKYKARRDHEKYKTRRK